MKYNIEDMVLKVNGEFVELNDDTCFELNPKIEIAELKDQDKIERNLPSVKFAIENQWFKL